MFVYLTFKEIWRNRNRFILFSLVIALITILVLFIAGLAEGLATANREYLAKLDGQLVVFQQDVKLSTLTSRLNNTKLLQVKRLPGVQTVGPVAFSNATVVFPDGRADIEISLIGVEPGQPGEAPAYEGRNLRTKRAEETVIDSNLAKQANLKVGDQMTLKTIQGAEEEFYTLEVVGITDGRQYFYQPSIFISLPVLEKIRPQPTAGIPSAETNYNILVVRLEDPSQEAFMATQIQALVEDVEVVDRVTAYEATPGYQAQQSTLNTQRYFTLLIGILVIGGFFQIQMLQKIPNIGMLKAVGTSNFTVGAAVVLQILAVTFFGVLLGTLVTFGLAIGLPDGIPILFTPLTAMAAIFSLTIIGPLGGLVSVWLAVRAEPLMALGLSS